MAYSYKISQKDFKPYNEAAMWNRVDIGPGRFIKIAAPNKEVLDCKVIFSDKPHYMVWPNGQGGDDSVNIHQRLDTLFITYMNIESKNNNEQYHRSVEIFVSEWQQLQIDGASVTLDSSFGNKYPVKQISLNNSDLHFGRTEDEQDQNTPGKALADSTNAFISSLQLKALNSNVVLNSNYSINNLQLGFMRGDFTIRKGAAINNVTGFISPDSHLNLQGAYLQKLNGLVVK